MARLNEPDGSTDSIDTLRRKFQRQNRDLARINSNQHLKIRNLESEYAKLLSENLDLRGRIIRLEKELEDNTAQRVADHALDIKAKLEAQLLECVTLLGSLGDEPPTKRRSPGRRRSGKPRANLAMSPLQSRRGDAPVDEGRLPSILENKAYPRKTLNRDEILSLREKASDSADSPDLGPPPVSRFVDEDPIKVESPCRPVGEVEAVAKMDGVVATSPPERLAAPKLDFVKKAATEPEKKDVQRTTTPKPAELPPTQAPRVGSKRKYGAGSASELERAAKADSEPSVSRNAKPIATRDLKNRRSVKDMAAARKDSAEKAATKPTAAAERKPLASKSTNEDISSPKKVGKPTPSSELLTQRLDAMRHSMAKDRPRETKKALSLDTLSLPPKTTAKLVPEPAPATPFVDVSPVAPDTPEQSSGKGGARDTPPPSEISSQGETTRATSRRSRSAISYAEPNLRDKMRRPTKELFDAVAGEGKFIQRSHKAEDGSAVSTSAAKEAELADACRAVSEAEAIAKEAARRASIFSPLIQKELSMDSLPTSVVTDRRKRLSSIGLHSSLDTVSTEPAKSEANGGRPVAVASRSENLDPYEFTTSSPTSDAPESTEDQKEEASSVRGSRMSRRSSSVLQERNTERASEAIASRKRASMAAPKRSIHHAEDSDGDGSYAPPGASSRGQAADSGNMSVRDRVSRRRSMML